jgi:hypothetical protein
LDVIYVDTPSGEVIKISSSSNLSAFSSGADPQCVEGIEAMLVGSPSISIRELWPNIDNVDVVSCGGASAVTIPKVLPPEGKSQASVKKSNKCVKRKNEKALLDDYPGPSVALPKSCRKGSTKRKAAQILSGAPRAISPHMRKSFVDRQYSPLTGMGLSEWEIIL